MKIVLDTNSLLVSIGRKSKYRPIFNALQNGNFFLLISNEIVLEYFEIISKKTNEIVAKNIVDFLLKSPNVIKTEIYFKWSLVSKDFDDNKFVDCALNGSADFIVTDDKHFSTLKKIKFPIVKTIKTAEFLEKTSNKPNS